MLFQSPGFSLVTNDKVEVGEYAESQCRIQPTNSFSKYWYELNLEPISHSPKVRHHADLAYAQLMDIAEEGDIDGDGDQLSRHPSELSPWRTEWQWRPRSCDSSTP